MGQWYSILILTAPFFNQFKYILFVTSKLFAKVITLVSCCVVAVITIFIFTALVKL